jgi:hypothetical protein
VTYRLNYFGEITRARFGHTEKKWAPGDKIVPIIAFGKRILVEIPPKNS